MRPRLTLLALALSSGAAAAWEDLILPPVTEGKTGSPAALFFAQGAGIATTLYADLGSAIQEAAPFPLWFASPQCLSDACAVPGTLKSGMARVQAAMADEYGFDANATAAFYGGHSLGGAMMPDYVVDEGLAAQGAKGMVLMGSFLTRKWRTGTAPSDGRPQVEFPLPTLTIGAELDGLCRVTRIAEALHTQVTMAEDPDVAVKTLPVTVVPGMNHYQFASGDEPPKLVAQRDLKPEITADEAHAAAANDTVAFLSALLASGSSSSSSSPEDSSSSSASSSSSSSSSDEDAWSTIAARASASAEFVAPQVAAFSMEGYQQFLPACLCENHDEYAPEGFAKDVLAPALEKRRNAEKAEKKQTGILSSLRSSDGEDGKEKCEKIPYLQFGTCEDTPTCKGGSPWTSQYAGPIMGGDGGKATNGAYEGLTVTNVDSLHIVTEECPSCHLPHIHGGIEEFGRVNYGNPGNTGHENNFNPLTPPLCSWSSSGSSNACTLNTSSVTQHVYDNSGQVDLWRISFGVPSADTGFLPLAARELRVKMKSRQAHLEAAGVAVLDPNATTLEAADLRASQGGGAGLGRCAEINQAAVDWARAQLSEAAGARYDTYGQTLVVGEDKDSWCPGGPCWIWDSLKFKRDDAAGTVNVQAVGMVEDNYNKFPCGEAHEKGQRVPCPTGFHYCKLLSPAKALEWMTVDGLRLNYRAYKDAADSDADAADSSQA